MFSQKDSVVNFVTADHYERLKILSELDQSIKKQKSLCIGGSTCLTGYEINNDAIRTLCFMPGIFFQFNNLEAYFTGAIWTSNTFHMLHAIDSSIYEHMDIHSLKLTCGVKYINALRWRGLQLTLGGGMKLLEGLILLFNRKIKSDINEKTSYLFYVSAGVRKTFKDLDINVEFTLSPKYKAKSDGRSIYFGIVNVFFIIKSKIYNA